MATKQGAARDIADSVTNGPIRFYLRLRTVEPMLQAIQQLQQRDDLSGKFARKCGQNRRALSAAYETLKEDRQALVKHHAEKFPAFLDDGVTPHPKAGQTTPVFQTKNNQPDGEPVFKKDAAGNDTDERVAIPDQYNLVDPMAFQKDFRAMLEEYIVIECPGFKESEFEAFKGIRGSIIDPLMDLEVNGETTRTPADYQGEDEKPTVEAEPTGEPKVAGSIAPQAEPAEEERTAP